MLLKSEIKEAIKMMGGKADKAEAVVAYFTGRETNTAALAREYGCTRQYMAKLIQKVCIILRDVYGWQEVTVWVPKNHVKQTQADARKRRHDQRS